MEPDATVRLNKHRHEPDEEREEDLDFDAESPEFESLAEPESDIPESQPSGVGARFRKFMQRSTTSEQKGSDKRKQLKEDRTKTFMMLAGGVVVMALVFFALFSSPSSSRKMNNARSNQPNLGRGPGGVRRGRAAPRPTPTTPRRRRHLLFRAVVGG